MDINLSSPPSIVFNWRIIIGFRRACVKPLESSNEQEYQPSETCLVALGGEGQMLGSPVGQTEESRPFCSALIAFNFMCRVKYGGKGCILLRDCIGPGGVGSNAIIRLIAEAIIVWRRKERNEKEIFLSLFLHLITVAPEINSWKIDSCQGGHFTWGPPGR